MQKIFQVYHFRGGYCNFNLTIFRLLELLDSTKVATNTKYEGKDDIKDELCDTIKDDMEVETKPNVYE